MSSMSACKKCCNAWGLGGLRIETNRDRFEARSCIVKLEAQHPNETGASHMRFRRIQRYHDHCCYPELAQKRLCMRTWSTSLQRIKIPANLLEAYCCSKATLDELPSTAGSSRSKAYDILRRRGNTDMYSYEVSGSDKVSRPPWHSYQSFGFRACMPAVGDSGSYNLVERRPCRVKW